MGQILAVLVTISSFITALTVIITAIKNGEKKIKVYEDQKDVMKKISEKIDFLDKLPEEIEVLNKKSDQITENLNNHMAQNQQQTDLLVEVARDLLIKEMKQAIDRGWCSVEDQERTGDLFGKYSSNGGNHGVGNIYNQYKMLPSSPSEKDK